MSGFPGSILDVFRAYDQGIDLIGQFEQQQNMQVARTPQEQEQGLRPAHQAGNVSQSMIFPNVPPNTPFNTKGMKAPINIQKFDEQGHLVKSYENVPPGISNLPTGPQRGTVIETPANMQSGGDYNMARAQELGYKPDAAGHYPSVDHETGMLLKSKEHPTVKLEFMSQMLSPERKMIANPTGYFGENQLQYVPRKMQAAGAKDSIEGDIDTAKETTEKPTNPGIVNTQNALRSRLGIDLPADGEWSDEWENAYTNYLDSENSSLFSDTNTSLLPRLVPGNVSALMGDVIYNQTGLSIGHQWSAKEKEAMDKIAKRNIEKGKYFIEYEDYDTGTRYGDVGGGEAAGKTLLKAYDPAYNLKTTFGQAQIGIAPEWGERKEDTVIFDRYNFNDGKDHSIVNPISWGNVGKRLVRGDIYGTIRSIGREFGSPDEGGRDVTMVTNRQKGGPRKFQYGDFLTGRETYEPYQAASDNTGVSIPPPPIPRLDPVSEETQQKIDEANKREYQEYLGSLPPGHPDRLGPQGITPMAFGPVEATLLGGAAIATGALSNTVTSAAAGIQSALNAPAMIGGTPIAYGSLTAGNLLNSGFAANSIVRLTGADGGENALDVIRDPNRSGLGKAGYFGMRGLELLPLAGAYSQGARGATSALGTSNQPLIPKQRINAALKTIYETPGRARRSLFGRPLNEAEFSQLEAAGKQYDINIDPYFYGAKFIKKDREALLKMPQAMRQSADDFKRLYADPTSPNRVRINESARQAFADMPDDLVNKRFNNLMRGLPEYKADPRFRAMTTPNAKRQGLLDAFNTRFDAYAGLGDEIHLTARSPSGPNSYGVRIGATGDMHVFTGRAGRRENLGLFHGNTQNKINRALSTADHEIYHTGTQNFSPSGIDLFSPFYKNTSSLINNKIPTQYAPPGSSWTEYRNYLTNMEELGARSYEARRQLAHFGDPYSIGGLKQMEQAIRGSSEAAQKFNQIAGQTFLNGRNPSFLDRMFRLKDQRFGYTNNLFSKDAGFEMLNQPPLDIAKGLNQPQRHALTSLELLRTLPAVGGIGVGVGLSQQRGQ